ncbi:hypothetical protein BJV78DRAFT_1289901 [Lactifluus subvellereus]|nr:hypothetical protein BJV78DRAFT_1289901 [Lactifluus subvellereus]
MAPYNRWAQGPFKKILLDSCDAYLESSDRGPDKTQSKLIKKVAEEIAAISERTHEPVLDDLEKTIPTEVARFFKNMKDRTGAVFIAFVAFPTEDGDQTYGCHELLEFDMMAIPNYLTKFLNSNFIVGKLS